MLASAPQAQFEEWRAYDRICPFGTIRGDMQAGIVANMLRNLNGHDPLYSGVYVLNFPDEDMPERRIMSPEEIEARMGAWAGAHNANCEAP